MRILIVLMLVFVVSSDMPDRFMDEPKMTKRIQPWERTDLPWIQTTRILCGRAFFWSRYHRRDLGASHKYTNGEPDVDTHLNEVPNQDKHVFEEHIPNTDVDDDANLNIEDEQNPNRNEDDVPTLDKNSNAGPEIYQHATDDQDLDKILGGSYARRGEIPWQVNLKVYGQHLCGGSYISEFYILTSAQCLYGKKASDLTVIVGNFHQREVYPGYQTFKVDKMILHENYKFSRSGGQYDIALIKIKSKSGSGIQTHESVQPICLPINDPQPPIGTPFVASGWGFSDTGSRTNPDLLKKTTLPLISLKTCKPIYGNGEFAPDMFCAGEINGHTDICHGDAGGPLFYKKKGMHILYGIIESSSGCSPPNFPAVFTNVSMYLTWIRQKLKQYSKTWAEEAIPMRPDSPLLPPYYGR